MLTGLMDRFPLIRGLIDFVYPPLCAGCREYTDTPGGICDRCLARIDWWDKSILLTDIDFRTISDSGGKEPESFPLFAAGSYTGPLREVVVQYKFRGATSVVPIVAERIATQFGAEIQKLSPALLVPIPLHPSREYLRGYNQAEVLAEAVSPLVGIPVVDDIIFRVRKRRPQSRLSKSKRASNIKSVFALSADLDSDLCHRVILVDDVVTSGQTLFEARRTLQAGGFKVVGAIAIAHRL
jgi:ComF family protein